MGKHHIGSYIAPVTRQEKMRMMQAKLNDLRIKNIELQMQLDNQNVKPKEIDSQNSDELDDSYESREINAPKEPDNSEEPKDTDVPEPPFDVDKLHSCEKAPETDWAKDSSDQIITPELWISKAKQFLLECSSPDQASLIQELADSQPSVLPEKDIWRILDYHRQFQNAGETGDLITMSKDTFSWKASTSPNRRYPLPTFTINDCRHLISNPCFDHLKFNEILYKKYAPELVGLNWNNVFLAGGLVGTIIHDDAVSKLVNWKYVQFQTRFSYSYEQPDIDLFIYGLTEKEGNNKVKEIVNHLLAQRKELQISTDLTVTRNQHVLTIEFRHPNFPNVLRKYQIIFKLYKTKSEILHGFDLGSSQGGFDGSTVQFTSLGKLAQEYGCNILDTSQRSLNYEKRWLKYLRRGYDLIMPYLSCEKLKNITIFSLHYFQVQLDLLRTNLSENRLVVLMIDIIESQKANNAHQPPLYNEVFPSGENNDSCFDWNLKCFLNGQLSKFVYMRNIQDFHLHDYDVNEIFTFSYEEFVKKLKEFYENTVATKIWDGEVFDTRVVKKYCTHFNSGTIGEHLFSKNCSKSSEKKSYIQHICDRQCNLYKSIILDQKDTIGFPMWKKDNPAGQFIPKPSTAAEYYGKYMVTE